jgi:hypothetical protein
MYLENGLYEDADNYFKKAIEILSRSMNLKISLDALIDPLQTCKKQCSCDSFEYPSLDSSVSKSHATSDVFDMPSELHHSLENSSQSGRKQIDSRNDVIGRPYWLTDHKKTPTHSFVSLLCIILYNHGLCYHRQGVSAGISFRHSKLHLGRAFQVYKLIQSMARNHRIPAPVLFLSLHNMSQIYHGNGDPKMGYVLSSQVSNILRILHDGKGGYERVLLGMISLQPWAFASAA